MIEPTQEAQVQDVEHRDIPVDPQPKADPALRSIYQENALHIGISMPEDAHPDGTFALRNALRYENIDVAIAQLESVLTHARQVQLALAYQQGIAAAQAQEAQPDSQE